MNRLQILSLLGVAATLASSAVAGTLTPEQALARLGSDSSTPRRIAAAAGSMQLAHTAYSAEAQAPAYYVFNKPSGGYVILTADDRLVTMLADVDRGQFNPTALPPAMSWWLSEYEREIGWALTHPESLAAASQPSKIIMKDERIDVEPLVATKWDQDTPYNDLCPSVGGTRAMTGCVATAMAQVINYHEWPAEHGNGEHSYTYRGVSSSFNYENTPFDWANMLDTYSDSPTEEQINAVANLMLACGVAVEMEYGQNESGTVAYRIAPGMVEYFDYAPCASLAVRDTYSLWEWEELIYQEMKAGRPVVYNGVGGMGGHSFVCDGYRKENYFHINWGWKGLSDGYFRLTSLNPSALGIGGGGGNFNYYQEAVVMACAPDKAEGLRRITPLYVKGNFTMTGIASSDEEGCVINANFGRGGIYANAVGTTQGKFGVLVTDEYEHEIGWYPYMEVSFSSSPSGSLYGVSAVQAYVPRLEEGNYRVYPAFLDQEGEWDRIPIYNGYNRYLTLSINEEREMTFGNDGMTSLPELEILSLITPKEVIKDKEANFMVDALNGNTDYSGLLSMYIADRDETLVGSVFLDIPASMYNLYTMPLTFTVEEGTYQVYIADCLNRRISSNFKVTVLPADYNGVDAITTDTDTECEWYDLQGRRLLERPQASGIYLQKTDVDVRKVVI